MKKIHVFIMLLAVAPMLMTGCKKEAKQQTSNVKFMLTDAPGQYDALNIDIKGIQVHSQTSGWVTLNSSLGVVNVMNYVNGNSTLIAEGSFAAGTIDEVRLMLGSNNSVIVNGTTHELQSTASLESSLSIKLDNEIKEGESYTWTLDFDAAQSVIASGSGSFQLDPAIRVIVDASSSGAAGTDGSINIDGNIDGTVVVKGSGTGNISGSISPAALASVCITGSDGSSVCTMTSLSGEFELQAIKEGTYSVTITPVLSITGAETISDVKVTAGQTTDIGIVSM